MVEKVNGIHSRGEIQNGISFDYKSFADLEKYDRFHV
tara:strand:- start:8345 stop:8455 length:111 start_codon:yes stop_codon:yes gene_type:complete